jgi:hypothetical protein
MALTVHVNRCYRHRGALEPKNRFVIGGAKDHFILEIGPICNIDKWLPQIERSIAERGMLKWAEGMLCPVRMGVEDCADDSILRDILQDAFRRRYAELRLEQFYPAHVYLRGRSLGFTIGSLINAYETVH